MNDVWLYFCRLLPLMLFFVLNLCTTDVNDGYVKVLSVLTLIGIKTVRYFFSFFLVV